MKHNQTMVTMTKLPVESSLKRLWTMHLAHCPTLLSMKCWTWWNRCSILPRIPSTSNRIFTTSLTRRCAASWMCPVTSLGASFFAFWGTKITKKSLIVCQRWRSTIARGVVTGPLLYPLITGEIGDAIPTISQGIQSRP